MIRRLIQVVCSPIVEPLLTRIERGVTIEDHKVIIHRLRKDIDKLQIRLQEDLSSHILNLDHLFDCNLFETCHELQFIQLADLMDIDIIDKDDRNWLVFKLKNLFRSVLWEGSRLDITKVRIVSSIVFFGLKRGTITDEQAIPIISKLINVLPTEAWFSSQGMLYGISYLLRVLLMLCQMEDSGTFLKYIEDIFERLLRRIEIKHQKAFQFQGDSLPLDASYTIEQLRLTLAMLDAANFFSDQRYLNAALKMNDWNYKSVRGLKIPRRVRTNNLIMLIIGLHYLMAINKQEELFAKLCQS